MEQQRTKEWFEKRKGRVTGSNVGAILGLDPWRTRDDVMRAMVRAYYGVESEFKGNIATEWGTFNEQNAIAELDMVHNIQVVETGFHIHPRDTWLGASPDGFVKDFSRNVVEIKCPFGIRQDKNPTFKNLIIEQPHYYAQVQIEMYCTDSVGCHFYQWTPHGEHLDYVTINHEWLNENLPKLKAFYDEFLLEIENPHPHLTDKVKKQLDSDIAEEYKRELEALENQKGVVDHLKSQLIELANGEKTVIGDLLVYKVERKGSISYSKIVKENLPDIDLEPYTGKPSTYWAVK
jgi:putative phage-type endonuclease